MAKAKNKDVTIVITDNNRLIIWVNDNFSKMTGYSLNEVKGKKPFLLQGRDSEKSIIRRIRRTSNEEKPFSERITNHRKNGEEYTCSLTIHPIFDTNGALCNFNFTAIEVDNNFVDSNNVPSMKLRDDKKKNYFTKSKELNIYYKLNSILRTEKLYLDPELDLYQVARIMKINSKYLSIIINNQTGKNFRYYLNKFRVQEFQKLLSSGDMMNYTLFSIANNCGFRNKSTFHKVIFNHTGKTPKSIFDNLKKENYQVSN